MTIGIIGGGQLGMMIAEAALKQGIKCIALDPNPLCSCSFVCEEIIVGEYNDLDKLKELGEKSDVITYEFENIKAEPLEYLVNNYNMPQGIKQLYTSQNRLREKDNARRCGLKTPLYYKITSNEELTEAIEKTGYPAIYKTTTLGYDGHGQYVIRKKEDLAKVILADEGILEAFIDYDYEVSIIMIRDKERIVSLPIPINYHKNGILDLSVVSKQDNDLFKRIKDASYRFMLENDYYGIITIEYFVKGDDFYFNEMAPRPHNSGHYSIEGCDYSQYDLLVNYLAKKELPEPKLLHNTIMKNILGFDYDKIDVLNGDNIYVHDYHKNGVKPNRKMGHITFTNLTKDAYDEKYKNVFKGDNNE